MLGARNRGWNSHMDGSIRHVSLQRVTTSAARAGLQGTGLPAVASRTHYSIRTSASRSLEQIRLHINLRQWHTTSVTGAVGRLVESWHAFVWVGFASFQHLLSQPQTLSSRLVFSFLSLFLSGQLNVAFHLQLNISCCENSHHGATRRCCHPEEGAESHLHITPPGFGTMRFPPQLSHLESCQTAN